MRYETTVRLPASLIARANRCLEIEDMRKLSDSELRKIGANTYQNEGILFAEFENGSTINVDLVSDEVDYHDDIAWSSADGDAIANIDSMFVIGDIEVKIDNDVYVVKVEADDSADMFVADTYGGWTDEEMLDFCGMNLDQFEAVQDLITSRMLVLEKTGIDRNHACDQAVWDIAKEFARTR